MGQPAAPTFKRLGSDLALTRFTGVPASVPLGVADSWGTLDLQVVPGGGVVVQTVDLHDLYVVSGPENLAQALIVRLLTHQGALAPLGHPEYGSRLVELIGRLNDESTRNLARLYTLDALTQEPRVSRVLDLSVSNVPGQPDTLEIQFLVQPLGDTQPLALALEVVL
jgi:phage baseplate assembly protein W